MINLPMESNELDKLIAARIAFNELLLEEDIKKDATGNRSDYVSLEMLQAISTKIMDRVGLSLSCSQICDNGSEYLVLTLRHVSGQFERSIGYLHKEEPAMDGQLAQVFGALLTYKTRYMWRTLLGIGRGAEDADSGEYIRAQPVAKKLTGRGLELWNLVKDHKDIQKQLFDAYGVTNTNDIPEKEFERAKQAILTKIAAKK